MNEMVREVRERLISAIKGNRIVLPTLPEVALRVREKAEDPNIDAAGIANVLSTDAAISARVMKVSNSPLLRAASPITDLKMAISRLGINYSCNFGHRPGDGANVSGHLRRGRPTHAPELG